VNTGVKSTTKDLRTIHADTQVIKIKCKGSVYMLLCECVCVISKTLKHKTDWYLHFEL